MPSHKHRSECCSRIVTYSLLYAYNNNKSTSKIFKVKELSASAGSALRYVIYTGEKPNQELVAGLKENKVELCSFEELQKIGEQLTIPHRPPQPRDTAFIM